MVKDAAVPAKTSVISKDKAARSGNKRDGRENADRHSIRNIRVMKSTAGPFGSSKNLVVGI